MLYHTKVKGYGSLWQPRYKSVLVQKDGYLSRLGRYIELNPIRAKMIDFSHLAQYPWSSAKFYLTGQADELINPLEHPYHKQFEQYGESSIRRYAQYLNLAHEDDLLLFRSEHAHIGDESFITSVINVIGSHMKLKVGRPRKKS